MLLPRIIPSLLMDSGRLVKTRQFRAPVYVGDPVNAVRVFAEKEADEILLFDIAAHRPGGRIHFEKIADLAAHCFVPLTYGGGIRTVTDVTTILKLGVEKIVINSAAYSNPRLIEESAQKVGSSSVVVCVDYKQNEKGRLELFSNGGRNKESGDFWEWIARIESLGAGEIIINSIDREGTMSGYDLNTIKAAASRIRIPVIASGGAGSLEDFRNAICDGRASACAAGTMFVFHGKHRAVLITYPERRKLEQIIGEVESCVP
jgi:imidazole glycerol-phosphate synthase subunit HisF